MDPDTSRDAAGTAADAAPRGPGGTNRAAPIGLVISWIADSVDRAPDAEQVAAMDSLLPDGPAMRVYLTQFLSLTVLSAAIASFGLLADSSAVVIGAMLVAPLMTPIVAIAAASVTARNDRLVRALLIVLAGMATAIVVGWLIAVIAAPEATAVADLPAEVRARTFPQLLDLGIAVSAGAAAGYVMPRSSALGALPGVGIAVALVPPLTSVGIAAQAGFGSAAGNALLLFLTNLAAIVFAAAVVLFATGFRPREVSGRRSVRVRLAVTFIAVAAVAIPLTLHTRSTLEDLRLQRSVSAALAEWDADARPVEIRADVAGGVASVDVIVSGFGEPPPAWQLAEGIRERFGGPVDLVLRYQRDDRFQVSAR